MVEGKSGDSSSACCGCSSLESGLSVVREVEAASCLSCEVVGLLSSAFADFVLRVFSGVDVFGSDIFSIPNLQTRKKKKKITKEGFFLFDEM